MAEILALPLARDTDSILGVWEKMRDMNVRAAIITRPGAVTLADEDLIWRTWETQETIGAVTGGIAIDLVDPLATRPELPAGKKAVLLQPASPDAVVAVLLAGPEYFTAYNLAPGQKVCQGPQKHSIPPHKLNANRTCGSCSHPVKAAP